MTYSTFDFYSYLMIVVGKWHVPFKNRIINGTYRFYSVFVQSFSFIMTQECLFSMFMFRDCHGRFVELSSYYVQYTNLNIISFLSNSEKIKTILDQMMAYENNIDSKIYEKYAKIARKVFIFILVLTYCTGKLIL